MAMWQPLLSGHIQVSIDLFEQVFYQKIGLVMREISNRILVKGKCWAMGPTYVLFLIIAPGNGEEPRVSP